MSMASIDMDFSSIHHYFHYKLIADETALELNSISIVCFIFSSKFFATSFVKNPKMLLYRAAIKYFAMMGIYSPSSKNYSDSKFNWKNLFFLMSAFEVGIFPFAFLLFEAETTVDRGNAFYSGVSGFAAMGGIFMTIWKYGDMLAIKAKIEKFIEKSQYIKCIKSQRIHFFIPPSLSLDL